MKFESKDGSIKIDIYETKGIIKFDFPLSRKIVRFESNFVNPYMALYGLADIAIGLEHGYFELSNSNAWRTLHLYNAKDDILVYKNGEWFLNGEYLMTYLDDSEVGNLISILKGIHKDFYHRFEDDGQGQKHLAQMLVKDGRFEQVNEYKFKVGDKFVNIEYQYPIWSVIVNHKYIGDFKIRSPSHMDTKLIDKIYDACIT